MRSILLILLIAGCFSFPHSLYAQDEGAGESTGTTAEEDLLPDIDPQDIEIRSDYRPSFPGLRRQPILGFDPTPRVYQIDPNRMPFLETSDEVVASVPVSTLQVPGSPVRRMLSRPNIGEIYARMGFGMFMTPDVQLALNESGPNTRFVTNLSLLSTDGATQPYNNSFRNARGYAGFMHAKGGTQWHLLVRGIQDMNYMPVRIDSTIQKQTTSYGFSYGYQHTENAFDYSDLSLTYDWYNQDETATYQAHRGGLKYENVWPGQQINSKWTLGAEGEASAYNRKNEGMDLEVDDLWFTSKLYANYSYRNDYNSKFKWGMSVHYAGDEVGDGFFIYPDIAVTYWGIDNTDISLGLDGDVRNPGMSGWYQENRFLNSFQPIRSHRGFRVYANISHQLDTRNELYGGFTVNRYTNYGLLFDTLLPSNANTLLPIREITHNVKYDQVQLTRFHAGYSLHSKPLNLTWNTELYYQNVLTDQLSEAPYIPGYGVSSTLIYSYDDAWKSRIWVEADGGRETSRASEGYTLLNADTRYWFTDHFSIYAKALNLLNQSYQMWAGYEEMPMLIVGGVTFKL